jgi:chromosomal replication initiator protein
MSSLQGLPLTKQLAEAALRSVMGRQRKPITVDQIISHVAKAFNVKPVDLKSRKKHKLFAFPRQVGMYLARELTECSYPEIGVAFGGKDHSTVIYAARKIEKSMAADESLKSRIEGLKQEIRK